MHKFSKGFCRIPYSFLSNSCQWQSSSMWMVNVLLFLLEMCETLAGRPVGFFSLSNLITSIYHCPLISFNIFLPPYLIVNEPASHLCWYEFVIRSKWCDFAYMVTGTRQSHCHGARKQIEAHFGRTNTPITRVVIAPSWIQMGEQSQTESRHYLKYTTEII